MEAQEIYEILNGKNVSARMIADALGVANTSVSDVIRNGKGSRRIAEAISKVIGKDLVDVFPHYTPKKGYKEKVNNLKEFLKVG